MPTVLGTLGLGTLSTCMTIFDKQNSRVTCNEQLYEQCCCSKTRKAAGHSRFMPGHVKLKAWEQILTKHWSLQMIMRTDSMFTISALSRISSAVGYGSATYAQQYSVVIATCSCH
jgi:hypothetical protein